MGRRVLILNAMLLLLPVTAKLPIVVILEKAKEFSRVSFLRITERFVAFCPPK